MSHWCYGRKASSGRCQTAASVGLTHECEPGTVVWGLSWFRSLPMDLPRQPHDASASSKRPRRALVSVCAAVLALALATGSPAAVQADTATLAPRMQQPANESDPGSSESMKTAMREAIPAGGAAMGESSPQKAASEEAAAPFRTQTEDTGRMSAQAFDPGHWRPSFGVAGQDVSAYQGTVD